MVNSAGNQKKRVAVIGAGCIGLTAIKECLDERDRIDVICFEQESQIGGQWRYTEVTEDNPNPYSSMYKSTIINVSKPTMTFSDFPIPGSWPIYLHNKKVVQYFEMFSRHFNLEDHIRFNTKVVEVRELKDEQNRWMVRSYQIPPGASRSDPPPATIQEDIFDYVMVCTGHHSTPRYPSFPGMSAKESDAYTGVQIHSHYYRKPDSFKEKNVMVVGLGNSAVDLAVELSMNECQVYLSRRNPVWVAPRWLIGKPLDHHATRFIGLLPLFIFKLIAYVLITLSSPKMHPLMKPSGWMFENHVTVNSLLHERITTGTIIPQVDIKRIGPGKRVEFVDGTVIEDMDAIIWCTGYHISIPVLDPMILSGDRGNLEKNQVWLWNYMLPPSHPNIAFIGLFQASGAIMPVAELQCRFLVQVLAGRSPLTSPIPCPAQMEKEIQETNRQIRNQYTDSPRHTIQVDYISFSDKVAKLIGCYPSFWKLVEHFGLIEGYHLWSEVIFGPAYPTHYRLVGPHAWVGDGETSVSDNAKKNQAGEAARQATWGYKGCREYINSKYMNNDGKIGLRDQGKQKTS
ncbi:Cyclopentanone 1,2-monooxygenase (CPMO) [Entomortierella beljakovae]|nr:Cyclopentanone 1,2-monooxygenase (CPMO) [Entomortierella beljakovae]